MATRTMDFLIRVHVKAEDAETDPRWIKRELIRHLAGDRGAHDGYSVFSTANGAFDVTHANGSGVWAVANTALDMLRAAALSEYGGTALLPHRLEAIDTLRHRLGPKPL